MKSGAWALHSLRQTKTCRVSIHWVAAVLALGWLTSISALADGCFVFKWNKSIDINEPTQKAIIVYDADREDLLLQVKYEGPLEEFGWLIPVPSLPKVEQGSMGPFYELSQLTQRHIVGNKGVATLAVRSAGVDDEAVKVIQVKTVGAYEVAILSAQDAGSLARWLQDHGYSLPEGKTEIVEDYIRQKWFFIAAKIQLNKGVGFKAVANAAPKNSAAASKSRQAIQAKLSSGELHPLLISFDTPKCIFPLKISAVGGKPSEVSIYVLSAEPLLNKLIFDKAEGALSRRHTEWAQQKPQSAPARLTSLQNMRTLSLATYLYASANPAGLPAAKAKAARKRDWSTEDLAAMSKESLQDVPQESLDDSSFYAAPEELLQCIQTTPAKLPQSIKVLPRLGKRDWYLTKQVRTFAPSEMEDLEFEPAIPVLAKMLARPVGSVTAQALSRFGSNAVPILVAASASANPVERANAVRGCLQVRDARLIDPLLKLLKDETPLVRLLAIRAAFSDRLFVEPAIALLRDPNLEIRQEATGFLSNNETPDRTPVYLALLADPDPNVRMHALGVATWINRYNPSQAVLEAALKLLKDPNEDVQSTAVHSLWKMNHEAIPREAVLPLLNSSRFDTITVATRLVEGNGLIQRPLSEAEMVAREEWLRARRLSSTEATVLATNRLSQVRLMSLKILERNGDSKAIELVLSLLRDPNSVVRSRAFATIQAISGENISENDPAKWEKWWAGHKTTFKPRD